MSAQRTKFAVGLFVASGFGIALLAIIWLGMSRYLEKGQFYVTYFDESVQGLDKDSPVKYRGVSIGRVESVAVAPDSNLIEVVLKIESGQALDSSIVAQLKSVGITGIMFVELDRMEKGEPDRSPVLTFPTEYPVVASEPSEISELLRGLDDVLDQIRSADVKGVSDRVKLALDNINQKVSDVDMKAISTSLESSLANVDRITADKKWDNILASVDEASRSLKTLMTQASTSINRVERTLAQVEEIVDDKEEAIRATIDDFRLATENANALLEKGTTLVSGTDESIADLKRHLMVVVRNLENASENLDHLAELLADQPSQLIFGQPPVPREVEPDWPEISER